MDFDKMTIKVEAGGVFVFTKKEGVIGVEVYDASGKLLCSRQEVTELVELEIGRCLRFTYNAESMKDEFCTSTPVVYIKVE